jgi:hypothetical protein
MVPKYMVDLLVVKVEGNYLLRSNDSILPEFPKGKYITMECGRVHDCSASPTQILAKSLSEFANDNSISFSEFTQTDDYESFYTDNNDTNHDQSKLKSGSCSHSQLIEPLQLNGERLLWRGTLQTLKDFVKKSLHEQGKWTSPGEKQSALQVQTADSR